MNTQNPIATLINAQRDAVVANAEAKARKYVEALIEFYTGKTLDEAAPRANSWRCDRATYKAQMEKHYTAQRLGIWWTQREIEAGKKYEGAYRLDDVFHFVGPNNEMIERFIDEVKEATGGSFDAYVAKLVAKVGDCDSASVEGYLWQYSILTVTKGETVERWKTQQIVNVSCLGKAFNQWPTRKMK